VWNKTSPQARIHLSLSPDSGRRAHQNLASVLFCGLVLLSAVACKPDKKKGLSKREIRLKNELKLVSRAMKSMPEKYPDHRVHLQAILRQASDYELSALEDEVQSALTLSKTLFNTELEKKLTALSQEVDDYLKKASATDENTDTDALNKELEELERKFRILPKSFQLKKGQEFEDLRRKLYAMGNAGARSRELIAKAAGMRRFHFHERAIGVLESFLAVPEFKKSPYAARIKEEIKVTGELARKWKEKKDAEDQIPWFRLFVRNKASVRLQRNFQKPQGGAAFDVVDGVLVCDNDEESPVTLISGHKKWENYIVEIEFQIVKNGFTLGVRASDWRNNIYDSISFMSSKYGRLNWSKVRIHVEGSQARIVSLNDFSFEEIKLEQSTGPIFLAFEGDSKVRLRSLRVKVLKPT
jgi:hypothetical protein